MDLRLFYMGKESFSVLCSVRGRSKRNFLKRWYGNNADDIADAKEHQMDENRFQAILEEFAPAYDCVKLWWISQGH
jgi:hypothetical protein